MSWVCRHDGQELSTMDLTIEEMESLSALVDGNSGTHVPWIYLSPMSYPTFAKGLVALLLTKKKGVNDAEAARRISELTLRDFTEMFELVNDEPEAEGDGDPKAEPVTDGSSGPSEPSDGTPT